MAALALGHHLVLCLMAGHAAQLLVLEFAGHEQVVSLLVTGGAVPGWCFITIGDVLRHVCLVTFLAVSRGLLGEVGFMALGAIRDFAVNVVARAAEERRMFAFVITQLDDLAGMAGQAGVGYVSTEFYVAWCVGIRVAAKAAGQLEMRFSFVALAAERDDLPCCGRVPVVAVLAADLRLVFAACRGDVGRRLAVTFDAVIIEQFRGLSRRCGRLRGWGNGGRGVGGADHALGGNDGDCGQQNNPYSFRHAAFFHRCCLLV